MKGKIILILSVFIMFSCSTMKTVKETVKTEKNTQINIESKKDSVFTIFETAPSISELNFDANDFILKGDFEQKISSGEGNETTIQKKGDNIFIRSENKGSKEVNKETNNESTSEVYNSEYVFTELNKFVRKTSLKYKILFFVLIIIWQRKFITQILTSLFPGIASKRIIKLFLG